MGSSLHITQPIQQRFRLDHVGYRACSNMLKPFEKTHSLKEVRMLFIRSLLPALKDIDYKVESGFVIVESPFQGSFSIGMKGLQELRKVLKNYEDYSSFDIRMEFVSKKLQTYLVLTQSDVLRPGF